MGNYRVNFKLIISAALWMLTGVLSPLTANASSSALSVSSVPYMSFNSNLNQVSYDASEQRLTIWSNQQKVRSFAVSDGFQFDDVWRNSFSLKVVSGNISGYDLAIAPGSEEVTYFYLLNSAVLYKHFPAQHISTIATLPEFTLKGKMQEMTNTVNHTIAWQHSDEDAAQTAFQQLLRQVSGNVWAIEKDHIAPTHNELSFSSPGGRYVIRKIAKDGTFRDSDTESSQGNGGSPEKVKQLIVDMTPPRFTSTPSVKVVALPSGQKAQQFEFGLSEDADVRFDVMDSRGQPYFSKVSSLPSGNAGMQWDGISSANAFREGTYLYEMVLQDPAGNRSDVVTGSVLFDQMPPVITAAEPMTSRLYSPNGDGRLDELTWTLSFSEPVTASYVITDAKKKSVYKGSLQPVDLQGVLLLDGAFWQNKPDGQYNIELTATDSAGLSSTARLNFIKDTVAPKQPEVADVLLNSIQPTSSFRLRDLAEPLEAEILFGQTRVTANLQQGSHTLSLARGNNGDGRYEGVISLTDAAGNRAVKVFSVTIDFSAPSVTEFAVPDAINLTKKSSIILLTDGADDTVALALETPDKTVLPVFKGAVSALPADFTALLLSRYPSLADAPYRVTAEVTDQAGNVTRVSRETAIGRQPVRLLAGSAGPVSFKDSGRFSWPYVLDGGAFSTVKRLAIVLENEQGVVVKELLSSANVPAGSHRLDMTGAFFQTLKDGVYYLNTSMVSAAGVESVARYALDADHRAPDIVSAAFSRSVYNGKDGLELNLTVDERNVSGLSASLLYQDTTVYQSDILNGTEFRLPVRFDQVGRLAEGHNPLTLQVKDRAGNRSEHAIALVMDREAPFLRGIQVEPQVQNIHSVSHQPFSVTAEFSEPVRVDAMVYNQAGNRVYTSSSADFQDRVTVQWDGKQSDLSLAEGLYQMVFQAVDRAGNVYKEPVAAVQLYGNDTAITNVRFSKPAFRPGAATDFSFDLTKAGTLTAWVENVRGEKMAEIAAGAAVRAGANTLVWDALDKRGGQVESGDYYMAFSFQPDTVQDPLPPFKVKIRVDGTPPFIIQPALSRSVIPLEFDGELSLSFQSAEVVNYEARLLDSAGKPVGDLENGLLTKGERTLTWAFSDIKPSDLQAGRYQVALVFRDELGNRAERLLPLDVVNAEAFTLNAGASYFMLTPDGDAVQDVLAATISMTGVFPVSVRADIRNAAGRPVVNVMNASALHAPVAQVSWDGRDERYALQPEDVYYLAVTATDALGRTVKKDWPVYLVTSPIELIYEDNGNLFSFNSASAVQSTLQYSLQVNYPRVLLENDDYIRSAKLNVEIVQQGRGISKEIIQVADDYAGRYDGKGLQEGEFELRISGEGSGRIPVAAVRRQYGVDRTSPATGTVSYVMEAYHGILSPSDPRLTKKPIVNADKADIWIASQDGTRLSFYDGQSRLLTTARLDSSYFVLRNVSLREGENLFFYVIEDAAGNRSATESVRLTADWTPPQLNDIAGLPGSELSDATPVYMKAGVYPVQLEFSEPVDGNLSLVLFSEAQSVSVRVDSVSGKTVYGTVTIQDDTVNGSYMFRAVNVKDAADNIVTLTWATPVVVDTLSPAAPSLVMPSLINVAAYTATLHSEPGSRVHSTISGQSAEVVMPETGKTDFPVSLAEGTHRIALTAEDKAGNVSAPYYADVTVDMTAPAVASVSLAPGTYLKAGQYEVTVLFTEALDASKLIKAVFSASGQEIPLAVKEATGNRTVLTLAVTPQTKNGVYSLVLNGVTDKAGNSQRLVSSSSYGIDTVAPVAPVITGVAAVANTKTLTATITAEPGTTLQVMADGQVVRTVQLGPVAPAEAVVQLQLAEGRHEIVAETVDKAGNRSARGQVETVVDVTAPRLTGAVAGTGQQELKAGQYPLALTFNEPVRLTNTSSVSFTLGGTVLPAVFQRQEGNTLYYSVTIPNGKNGNYQVTLHQITDGAGNAAVSATGVYFTVDTTAPPAPYFATAVASLNSTQFKNEVIAEPGTTVFIYDNDRLMTSFVQSANRQPVTLTMTEGTHRFSLTATDRAGNTSVAFTHSLMVDVTGIQVTEVSVGPSHIASANTYAFTVTFSEAADTARTPEATITFSNGVARKATVTAFSGNTLTGTVGFLPGDNGNATLTLKTIYDRFGNSLGTYSTSVWTVDTAAPAPVVVKNAAALTNAQPYGFTVQGEPDSDFIIYKNGVEAARLASGTGVQSVSLVMDAGTYQLSVRNRDRAGNVGNGVSWPVTIDRTMPAVSSVTIGNKAYLAAGTYPVTIALTEAPDTAALPVVALAAGETTVPVQDVTYANGVLTGRVTISAGAANGNYRLRLTGLADKAGNRTDVTADKVFTVDTVSPAVPSLVLSRPYHQSQELQTVLSAEAGSKVRILANGREVYQATVEAGSTPVTLRLNEGVQEFELTATDAAGNISASGRQTLTVDTVLPAVSEVALPSTPVVGPGQYQIGFYFSEPLNTAIQNGITVQTESGAVVPVSLSYVSSTYIVATLTVSQNTPNGATRFYIAGLQDLAANIMAAREITGMVIDTVSPAPVRMTGAALTNSSVYALNVEAEPGSRVVIRKGSRELARYTQTAVSEQVVLTLDEGANMLTATATDAGGNVSSPASHEVKVDLTGLAIVKVTLDQPSPVSANRYEFSVEFSEDLSHHAHPKVYVQVENGRRIPADVYFVNNDLLKAAVIFAPGDNGRTTIQVTNISDIAGNDVAILEAPGYVVDTLAPGVPVLAGDGSLLNTAVYNVRVDAETGSKLVVYDNGVWRKTVPMTGPSADVELWLTEGGHRLTFQATDAAGNQSEAAVREVTVDVTLPLVAEVVLTADSPVSANAYGVRVTFSESLHAEVIPQIGFRTQSGEWRPVTISERNERVIAGQVAFEAGDDGVSKLEVSAAADRAGNVMLPVQFNGYEVDTLAPAMPQLGHTNAYANSTTYENNVYGEKDTVLHIAANGVVIGHYDMGDTSYSASFSLEEGSHRITFYLVDAAGNLSEIAAHDVIVDVTAPSVREVVADTDQPVSANTYALSIYFSEPADTAETPQVVVRTVAGNDIPVTVTRFDAGYLEGTVSFQPGDDGQSVLVVRNLADVAGNKNTPFEAPLFMVDTVQPEAPVVLNAPSLTNLTDLSLDIETEEGTTLVIVQDGTPVYENVVYSGQVQVSLPVSEGDHVFRLYAIDRAGNRSADTLHDVRTDITKPQVEIVTPDTPSPVSANSYVVTVSFDEPLRTAQVPLVRVRTQAGQYREVMVTSFTATGLTGTVAFAAGDDGQAVVEISRFYDEAGNEGDVYTEVIWLVDTTAPQVPQLASTAALSNNASYLNAISGEAGTQLFIRLDGEEYLDTTMAEAPYNADIAVSEGDHVLAFQLKDAAGNLSPVARHTIRFDRTKPLVTEMIPLQESPVSANRYTLSFRFDEEINLAVLPVVTVYTASGQARQAEVVMSDSLSGSASVRFQPGDDGQSEVEISGYSDLAGNEGDVIRFDGYLVDTTAPEAPAVVSGPVLTNQAHYVLRLSAEQGSRVAIRENGVLLLDAVQTGAVTDYALTFGEGVHALSISAKDAAGNVSLGTAHSLTLDMTAPALLAHQVGSVTPLKAGTYGVTLEFSDAPDTARIPTVRFLSGSQMATVRQTGFAGNRWNGEVTVAAGMNGVFELDIAGVYDAAGNRLDVRSGSYAVDTARPVISLADSAASVTLNTLAYANTVSVSEPECTFFVSYDGQAFAAAGSGESYALQRQFSEGAHSVRVYAVDRAGNQSDMMTQSVLVDVTAPQVSFVELPAPSPVKAGQYDILFRFSEPVREPFAVTYVTFAGQRRPVTATRVSGTVKDYRTTVTVQPGDNGLSRFEIASVVDLAGNSMPLYTRDAYVADTTAPQVTAQELRQNTYRAPGGRDVVIGVGFSETVQADYALLLPNRPAIAGTLQNGTVAFVVPDGVQDTATFRVSSIRDTAGNTAADVASLTFPVDSLKPSVGWESVVATTNRGTPSAFTVWGTFNEPVDTSDVDILIRYPDQTQYLPVKVIYSPDRTRFEARFSVGPVEGPVTLYVRDIHDDARNWVSERVFSLGQVDNVAPVITEYGANQSTFSARRSAGEAQVQMNFDISGAYSELTAVIYDRQGNTVATLREDASINGIVYWNGKDQNGQYVPKGWYIARAWARDDAGNESLRAEGLFEITEDRIELSAFGGNPQLYSFKSRGPVRFTYTLNEVTDSPAIEDRPGGIRAMEATPIAVVTEEVFRVSGSGADTLVAVLVRDAQTAEFSNNALGQWNGRLNNDPAAAFVQSGQYYIAVTVRNMNGIHQDRLVIPFTVDHTDPAITVTGYTSAPVSTRPEAGHTFTVTLTPNDNLTSQLHTVLSFAELSMTDSLTVTRNTSATLRLQFSGRTVQDKTTQVQVSVADAAGNTTQQLIPVRFDSTPPQFSMAIPNRMGFVSQNITVNVSNVSDASGTQIRYMLNNGGMVSQNVFAIGGLPEGEAFVTASVTDAAGNVTEKGLSVVVDRMISVPSFSLIPLTNTRNVTLTAVSVTPEAHPYRVWWRSVGDVSWQNSLYTSGMTTLPYTLSRGDGTYTVELVLEDKAGNKSTAGTALVTLDTVPPAKATAMTIPNALFHNGSYYIDSAAQYNPAQWAVSPKAAEDTVIFTPSWQTVPVQGANTVRVELRDPAGNVSAPAVFTVIYDPNAPVVTLTFADAALWHNGASASSIQATSSDSYPNTFSYSVERQGQVVKSGSILASPVSVAQLMTGLSSGEYVFKAVATDLLGHATERSVSVKWDVTAPLVTGFFLGSAYINASQSGVGIGFGSRSDAHSGIVQAEYYYRRQGTTPWLLHSAGLSLNQLAFPGATYSDGAYQVMARIYDAAGNITETAPLAVSIDRAVPVLTALQLAKSIYNSQTEFLNATAVRGASSTDIVEYTFTVAAQSGPATQTLNQAFATLVYGDSLAETVVSPDLDRQYNVSVRARDAAGNVSAALTVPFRADVTAPQIQQASLNQQYLSIATNNLQLAFSGSDFSALAWKYRIYSTNQGNALYASGNVAVSPFVITKTLVQHDGRYQITMVATDEAGNVAESTPVSFYRDTVAPAITIEPGFPLTVFQADGEGMNVTSEKSVLTKYRVMDNTISDPADPLARNRELSGDAAFHHTVRIFNEDRDLVRAGYDGRTINYEFSGNSDGYHVRWNGWVNRDYPTMATPNAQMPEGVYFVETRLSDEAGNLATAIAVVKMTDDEVIEDSSEVYALSAEDGGNTLKWGEGNRMRVFEQQSAHQTRRFYNIPLGIDVPQGIYIAGWSEQNAIDFDHVLDYFGPHALENGTFSQSNQNNAEEVLRKWKTHFSFESFPVVPGYYFAGTSVSHGVSLIKVGVSRYERYKIFDGLATTGPSVTLFSYPTNIFTGTVDGTHRILFGGMSLANAFGYTLSSGTTGHYLYNGLPVLKNGNPVMYLPLSPTVNIQSSGKLSYGDMVFSDRRQGVLGYLHQNNQTKAYFLSAQSSVPGATLIQPVNHVNHGVDGGVDVQNFSVAFNENGHYRIFWVDTRGGVRKIRYQTVNTDSIYSPSNPDQVQLHVQAVTSGNMDVVLTAPLSDEIVADTRPAFTWQVPTANVTAQTRFVIQLFKGNVAGTEALPTFNFVSGSQNDDYQSVDVNPGAFELKGTTVHFRPDAYNSLGGTEGTDVYRWQVGADWNGDGVIDRYSTTSEVFKVEPPLQIEAPINYPNPFKVQTRIRYKLSRDAKDVYIRIYDAAGRVVRTLNDAPTEGTQPYHEYHDVLWDGRNGVGDEVNNGVYIYKIIAVDQAGRKAEARGKALKLK